MSNKKYKLQRENPKTGFTEMIIYTGSLRNKPRGWKVVDKG